MAMPIDVIFVRHGESEGNLAKIREEIQTDWQAPANFLLRHSSQYRLTDKGREQAGIAGEWIKENIGKIFFRYYVSEYIRALETAQYLKLPSAYWYRDFYLRERDWGRLEEMMVRRQKIKYDRELERKKRDGFFWSPPGGESMARLCLRLDRILGTWSRECSDGKVICVCHGEVMWGFRVRLERMTQQRYAKLDISTSSHDRIHNCQIIHYSRRNPDTGEIEPYLNWMRSVCPTDLSLSSNKWQRIVRPKYSNEDLMKDVKKVPQIIS